LKFFEIRADSSKCITYARDISEVEQKIFVDSETFCQWPIKDLYIHEISREAFAAILADIHSVHRNVILI
jgi:hypothetical protein